MSLDRGECVKLRVGEGCTSVNTLQTAVAHQNWVRAPYVNHPIEWSEQEQPRGPLLCDKPLPVSCQPRLSPPDPHIAEPPLTGAGRAGTPLSVVP